MAFSKARLLRFNDVSSCAPPPGAYNPKYDEHVLGQVKYTKDKIPEVQSPGSSTSDVRSVTSGVSVSSFRTPTIPRRRKITMPNSTGSKNKTVTMFSPQKSEALREKIVECVNKDETIKDLEHQLEELKFAISNLNVQKQILTTEYEQATENLKETQHQLTNVNEKLTQRELEKNTIVDEFNKQKMELKAENAAELKQFRDNLILLEERLKINTNTYDTILRDTEEKLEETKSAYNNLEKEFFELQEKYYSLESKYEESVKNQVKLENKYSSEMDALKRLHETEINEIESEKLEDISNWKKTVVKIEKDHENKINDLEVKQKTELEKMKHTLISEKTELQNNVTDLQSDISICKTELDETKKKLEEEINQHEKDKTAALTEKHCYEITLKKTYDTVNALKIRLLNSDKDVEQLTKELENLKKAKFENEEKYVKENDKLKKTIEELKLDSEALLAVRGIVVSLEKDLLDKIDTFKSKADCEITRLTAIIDKQSLELKKLHSFIKEQQNIHSNAYAVIRDARTEIENLESEVTEYKLKYSVLQTEMSVKVIQEEENLKDKQIKELKDKLKERDQEMNELASIYKKYIEKSRQYDDLQQKYEEIKAKYRQLEIKVAEQNALIGPFREQLENYEMECQVLMLHKGEAEKEAKEMGLKYAEILGHQNYKQKLKHMVDLKKKNIDLMESKHKNEAKIMQQNRTIEKLKQKISQMNKTKTIDKENVGSPVRMSNILSPVAFKERN